MNHKKKRDWYDSEPKTVDHSKFRLPKKLLNLSLHPFKLQILTKHPYPKTATNIFETNIAIIVKGGWFNPVLAI